MITAASTNQMEGNYVFIRFTCRDEWKGYDAWFSQRGSILRSEYVHALYGRAAKHKTEKSGGIEYRGGETMYGRKRDPILCRTRPLYYQSGKHGEAGDV